MQKLWSAIVLVRSSYEALPSNEKFWVVFHLAIDAFIMMFLAVMIYVGATSDPNSFYFWVPFLGFILWVRIKQAKARLSL